MQVHACMQVCACYQKLETALSQNRKVERRGGLPSFMASSGIPDLRL